MTKKSKAKAKKKVDVVETEEAIKLRRDLRHYMVLLKNTERNITNDGTDLDEGFKNQLERVKKLIREALK